MKALALIVLGALASQMLVAEEGAARPAAFLQTAEQGPTSRAERYLFDLALASKRARSKGYVLMGAGAAMSAGGLIIMGGVEDEDGVGGFFEYLGGITLVAGGLACVAGGVGAVAIASGPEKRYAVIRSISDPAEKELASREALTDLSRSGKTKRYIMSGVFSALAVGALVTTSDPQSALIPGTLMAVTLLTKSREERTYARFLAQEGIRTDEVNVGLGLGPRGGFRLVLTASF
ncbi:MAG: hypothetical protein EHM31_02105 [Candidatus Aminicenantes bacterium]|nr:MAG: hypothetical protein EHM31_02105 [Candidatus Aminicenantes bacterium]